MTTNSHIYQDSYDEYRQEAYSCWEDGIREELEEMDLVKLEKVARDLAKQHGWSDYVDEWLGADEVPPTKEAWIDLILESGSVADVDRYLHPDTYANQIDADGYPYYTKKRSQPSLGKRTKED